MTIQKYGVAEFFYTAKVSGDPFKVVFEAKVFCPGGKTVTVPGFYDGDDTFRVRFMPEQEGAYSYVTNSSEAALSDKAGSFVVVPAAAESHGKVKVKDQYWLEYQDGSNYYEAGTTCYAWIYQSEELREMTLKTLSKGYFNKMRMCTFPKWYEHNRKEPELYPFEGTLGAFDYDRPNVKLFQLLDEMVLRLEALGIEADIILFHPYDKPGWDFSNMSKEQDKAYLKYVMARLGAYHNVWWSLANEFDIFRGGYKSKNSNWKELVEFVAEHNTFGHMIGIHQCMTMYDHRDPNLTHCSIQRDEIYVTAENTDEWRDKFGKPVVIDECSYEGSLAYNWGGISAEEMVRRFWEATARGGYMGHGETYVDDENDILWWSHGGVLHGQSPERIRFLRQVMDLVPNQELSSKSRRGNFAIGKAGIDTQLIYFGYYQPKRYELALPKAGKYRCYVIDTWNMTMEKSPELMSGHVVIELPERPWCAILFVAEEKKDLSSIPFDADTVLEDTMDKPGGKKFVRYMKFFMKLTNMEKFSDMAMKLTVNQAAQMSGMDEKKKAEMLEGYRLMIDENKMLKGGLTLFKAMKK